MWQPPLPSGEAQAVGLRIKQSSEDQKQKLIFPENPMQHKFFRFSFAVVLASVSLLMTSESGHTKSFSGGFLASRVVQIRWTSTTLSSDYLTKYVRPAVNGWNGVSSLVSLSQVGSGAYDVNVATSTTPTSGLVGILNPYCPSLCSTSGTWSSAQLIGYTNQIALFNLSDSEIIGTVYAHEFGHALSMAHTSPPVGTISIMQSGFRSSYLPQAFDKSNLKQRWGN